MYQLDGYGQAGPPQHRNEVCEKRKLRHRGLQLVGWMLTFAAAAYNMVRIRNLATASAEGNA